MDRRRREDLRLPRRWRRFTWNAFNPTDRDVVVWFQPPGTFRCRVNVPTTLGVTLLLGIVPHDLLENISKLLTMKETVRGPATGERQCRGGCNLNGCLYHLALVLFHVKHLSEKRREDVGR